MAAKEQIHPLFRGLLAPFAPKPEEVALPGSGPTRCYVLCDCFENSDPDPDCPKCKGFGELEVPGF
ncbi:MAG TPA: hypothetical protein VLV48_01530 [Thermoanaerobaculia bacterium]|nr:hypothetical protein [Thermoanaerobaculia bacterium]